MKVLARATDTSAETLLRARTKLRGGLDAWRRGQLERYPQLQAQLTPVEGFFPEKEGLLFPSQFNEPVRQSLGLAHLAAIERSLREGQAHDALHDLRLAIQTHNHNLKLKETSGHGQAHNTRWQSFLKTLSKSKVGAADKYRRAYTALLALGLSVKDQALQPLHDNELWGKNESREPAVGETKKVEPWFWAVGRPSGLSQIEELKWSVESESPLSSLCCAVCLGVI